jgi:hypothetical protein
MDGTHSTGYPGSVRPRTLARDDGPSGDLGGIGPRTARPDRLAGGVRGAPFARLFHVEWQTTPRGVCPVAARAPVTSVRPARWTWQDSHNGGSAPRDLYD